MKKCGKIVVIFGVFLGLMGCEAPFSLPRATEPRQTAIASVLAVEVGETVTMYSVSQSPGQGESSLYEGVGASFAEAMLDSRDGGTESVSYAHVEHVILGEESVADLGNLLSFCLKNGEQSMTAKLWLLDEISPEEAFENELEIIGRLDTLTVSGESGTSLVTRSLGETAVKLAKDGTALLPMLGEEDGNLVYSGYAMFCNGEIVGYLMGEAALYGGILSGDRLYWVENAVGEESAVPVQLYSKDISFVPEFEDGVLTALAVHWQVEGQCTEDMGGAIDEKSLEKSIGENLLNTLKFFQELGIDPTGICEKSGLEKPWRWDEIKAQWESVFPGLEISVTVDVYLDGVA